MENFTPVESTLGGALIGLSAAMVLLLHGRICGISGILGTLLGKPNKQTRWTSSFILGLLVGGTLIWTINPNFMAMTLERSPGALVGAGLLVGLGTTIGNGCTSGHGVCGISRFSLRSIIATCTFMATGGMAVFFVSELLGGTL